MQPAEAVRQAPDVEGEVALARPGEAVVDDGERFGVFAQPRVGEAAKRDGEVFVERVVRLARRRLGTREQLEATAEITPPVGGGAKHDEARGGRVLVPL